LDTWPGQLLIGVYWIILGGMMIDLLKSLTNPAGAGPAVSLCFTAKNEIIRLQTLCDELQKERGGMMDVIELAKEILDYSKVASGPLTALEEKSLRLAQAVIDELQE